MISATRRTVLQFTLNLISVKATFYNALTKPCIQCFYSLLKCWMKQLAVTHFLPRSFLQEPPYFGCLPRMSAISGIQLANNPYNREIHNLVTCNIEPQVKRHYFLDMLYNTNNWVASLWKEFEKNIVWCLYNFSKTFLYIQVFV